MHPALTGYGYLGLAIICEVIGTSFMKQSEQFTRLVPSVITILTYACAFFMLSQTLKTLPVGIAYAIWSGVGIVIISLIGVVAFKQHLDLPAMIGMGMIVGGVVVINVFSTSSAH